jgi:hypothetical protein
MAVVTQKNRVDTLTYTSDVSLAECFQAAIADVTDYTNRNFLIVNSGSRLDGEGRQQLQIAFRKENV